jgi:hypothetical protein
MQGVNFLELRRGEVRRIHLAGTSVNKAPSETVCDLLHGRGSGAPRTGTQGIVQAMVGKEIT